MTVSIKICGLSDENSVKAVAAAGADYAGFVYFPPSPRHLSFERAAGLKALLPPSIRSVSVMVDPDDALLSQAQEILKPDYAQLHGGETPQRVLEIRKKFPAMKIIKALLIKNKEDVAAALPFQDNVDMLMFDARPPANALPGGNALSFDWTLLRGWNFTKPWFLSGGLNMENVIEAIRISGATMVDVSSGVESSRGVKDDALIKAFVKAARHET